MSVRPQSALSLPNAPSRTRRPARPAATTTRFAPLEPLEDRRLLADLGVAWDTDHLRLPAVLVPGDRFDPAGGNGRIEAPILIANNGPEFADGAIGIKFFLSTDTSLSAGDILLRSYTNQQLQLPVFGGNVDNLGTFSPDMRIPPETPEGTYFLLAQIIPSTAIGDFNSANNVAASPSAVPVMRRFGSFSGRTDVPLALVDPQGTILAFTLTGGGSGTVSQNADAFGVTITGSTVNSNFSIQTNGGDARYDLSFVTITGPVGAISAPGGRLTGTLQSTVGFGNVTLGDVSGPTTINVPGTSASPRFTFGTVNDLSVVSAVGIASITAASWNNLAAGADVVSAPSLDALNITGNAFLDLNLSGRAAPAYTLGNTTIGGVIKGGTWIVNGKGANVTASASTAIWSASFKLRLDSLVTTNTLRGVVTAFNFGTVSSGKDILAASILAGTWLGSDGRLGGSGPAADAFGPGKITTLFVARNVANSTIAAGLDPVDGIFRNGNDRIAGGTQSSIIDITVGNVAGMTARFLTNRYFGMVRIGGQTVDWRLSDRFTLSTTGPAAALQSTLREDNPAGVFERIRVLFTSTGLIDRASITDGVIRVTGPGGFTALGSRVSNDYDPSSAKAAAFGEFLVKLADDAASLAPGTYTVSVVPGLVKDVRNNTTDAVNLGTFTI
jgi:hypothetical protein